MKTAAISLGLVLASPAMANDNVLEFQIESHLAYLLTSGTGISSIDVTAHGYRTDVVVGVSDYPPNFSDVMWDIATRASLMSNATVTLRAVSQTFAFTSARSKRVCFLKARRGQVFDGTC